MEIWTVLVEDDWGYISETYCFTEQKEAEKFCKYVVEESLSGLTAYRTIKNKIYKDVTSAIFDFDKRHGDQNENEP